ncbi:carbohydrate porin [Denitromonas ohlonensis]|uniref:Carbohydrate porin n=2 Tax=Denitromonas TaxID=139331 RepID=A0A557RUF8_9RHOO|nr:carbohydrate porin [Denitromonas ohlonensis]TVO68793.1 carbohydrate porin [Denitromonas ohlonensis]TVO72841.1 carbohydrate porin [Denitromonas ohlonensis]
MRRFALPLSAAALTLLVGSTPALAADDPGLRAIVKQLAERIAKLEARNASLEGQLKQASKPTNLEARVKTLEADNRALATALDSERISDTEPALATRLKTVEQKAVATGPANALAEALDGISAEVSVGAVAQHLSKDGRTDGKSETVLGWRGDVGVTLPAGRVGNGEGQFFFQARFGQDGSHSDTRPFFNGATNSMGFEQESVPSENTNAVLAQAWYQLDTPIGASELDGAPARVEFTIGKMDPFVFFDQNGAADDESTRFLNNVFVHNPLLDSGGQVGADSYGFTPGARLAYVNEENGWGASIGVFGAGDSTTFGKSFTQPFVIAQLEKNVRAFGGFDGTYRVYAWNNPQAEGYDGEERAHAGWGISADQQVSESLTLFTRYGHGMRGRAAFDRALTVGGELTGNAWKRGNDGLGFAWAWLRSSKGFRAASAGLTDWGYDASGAEQVAEIYYRYQINDHLALTPDLQFIRRAGADGSADLVTAAGVRALYAF